MTLFSYINLAPLHNINRGYCRGVAVRTDGISGLTFSDRFIEYDDSGGIHWRLALTEKFVAPTSNTYSLDYIWDAEASVATIAGVPTAAGAYIFIDYMPEEPGIQLQVQASASTGARHGILLPPLPSSYWRKFNG